MEGTGCSRYSAPVQLLYNRPMKNSVCHRMDVPDHLPTACFEARPQKMRRGLDDIDSAGRRTLNSLAIDAARERVRAYRLAMLSMCIFLGKQSTSDPEETSISTASK